MQNKAALLIALKAIPQQRVISYGGLAKSAGLTNGARQVGALLKSLPCDTTLPWHRVVNSQRKISFAKDSEQFNKQKRLLQDEGIIFIKDKICQTQFMG